MAIPRIVSVSLTTDDDDNVAQNQTPGGAGNLTLNGVAVSGGVATFDKPRRVKVTTVSDESGKTLTIYGTDRSNQVISEAMIGPNATSSYTAQDFKTVTRVAVSAAFTGNVKVGTNTIGSSRWLNINHHMISPSIGIAVVVSGTVNYTVETTYDEIAGHYVPGVPGNWTAPATPTVFPDPVGGSTANDEFQITTPVRAVRLTVNSGTGTATMTLLEGGLVG